MKKGVLISLLLVAMILIVTQEAFARAGCQTATGENWVETLAIPTAPGTKVGGVLSTFYEQTNKKCEDLDPSYCPVDPNAPRPYCGKEVRKMVFAMRLVRGLNLFPFSGSGLVCYKHLETHADIFREFITAKVIPIVFPENKFAGWELKSVDNIIEDDNYNPDFAGCCSELFSIMDITIAVQ